MLTLLVLRHAKSSWDDSSLDDFDRPLAPRGKKAAPKMGQFIVSKKLEPDLVLCSSAKRARQTLELVLSELSSEPEVKLENKLYFSSPKQMLYLLREVPSEIRSVMLIGHNPGLQAFAVNLLKKGKEKDISSLMAKFPTAGLCVFDFDLEDWSDLEFYTANLRLYQVPRKL